MCRYSEIKDYTFGQEPCGGPVTGDPSLWDDCLYFSLNQLKLPFMLVCCTIFFFERNLPFNDQIKFRNLHQGHFHFPGHFSQVVWRDSTQLGVGLAQKDGKVHTTHIIIIATTISLAATMITAIFWLFHDQIVPFLPLFLKLISNISVEYFRSPRSLFKNWL